MFSDVSPLLLHEATTEQIHERLTKEVRDQTMALFDKRDDGRPLDKYHAGHEIVHEREIKVSVVDLETIVVQFAALGYISQSTKNRSVKDRKGYWTLTPFGKTVMNQLRAVISV